MDHSLGMDKEYVFLYLFSGTLPYRGEMRLCVIYPIPLSMSSTLLMYIAMIHELQPEGRWFNCQLCLSNNFQFMIFDNNIQSGPAALSGNGNVSQQIRKLFQHHNH